jgi:ABC-type lipoprotein export system ATPase subunit
MNNNINKISKVEIKSLWNRFDLTWNLQPDVNILSGINGSGKSTILNCIASLALKGYVPDRTSELIKSVEILFNNGVALLFDQIQGDIKSLEHQAMEKPQYGEIVSQLKDKEGSNPSKEFSVWNTTLTPKEPIDLIIDVISTFDNVIPEAGKHPDENVKTELDRDIFRLQKQYLDYQLNIGKKAFEAVTQNNAHIQEDVQNIRKQQEKFLEIIDNLFKDTGKKINREKNEIVFTSGTEELTAYQLSSGEKQILVILLTVLVQDNKPSIIFMDEPEISLHFDWQKKLIQYIRELNPNVQIILATHSPAVIMEGWRDKVSDVRDLITLDRQKATT